jgi:hypothetical protein
MTEFQESLRVVRGNPTPEELAAVLAILEVAATEEAAAGGGKAEPRSTWNRGHGQLRSGISPGSGQWNASFRDGLN